MDDGTLEYIQQNWTSVKFGTAHSQTIIDVAAQYRYSVLLAHDRFLTLVRF